GLGLRCFWFQVMCVVSHVLLASGSQTNLCTCMFSRHGILASRIHLTRSAGSALPQTMPAYTFGGLPGIVLRYSFQMATASRKSSSLATVNLTASLARSWLALTIMFSKELLSPDPCSFQSMTNLMWYTAHGGHLRVPLVNASMLVPSRSSISARSLRSSLRCRKGSPPVKQMFFTPYRACCSWI